ncbi:hypothetical protein DE146DRAFT_658539 [Phaeosphaeria sp. MPI-PUGE-AT-0046c]|nr:hypothetical protein DE146DRAFT_658539 [Phaeosphaeria sp. MPI-PUGE-AT-0046c]
MSARGSSANRGWLQEGMIRGNMLGKVMLPGDEELGKKDDDHRYMAARRSGWSIWNHSFRWRRRRLVLAVVGLGLVYMLLSVVKGRQISLGQPIMPGYHASYGADDKHEPKGVPPGVQSAGSTASHTFDGRIRYYRLAKSLRKSAAQTGGYDDTNRNVLFAMSSLQSASKMLPMICEMSKWNRNYVHAALMGRVDIPLQELLQLNGIDETTCPAIWHDARPDFTEYSTDSRAHLAVIGAMGHIHNMLHPQAVIVDDAKSEDDFFVRAIRNKTEKLGTTLIEVPKDKWDQKENFLWLTRLDAGSLKKWRSSTVDLLIQVPSDSSNVLRLLKSIKDADYSGMKPPRIILELPAQLDEAVKRRVENFEWPPQRTSSESSGFIVRRRIMNHRATQEDAAMRFLELFYPTSATNSHVLLLSPEAQLSPLYYHYVKYMLLEYKFSEYGKYDSAKVMGVSLELPETLLDGKTALMPPKVTDMHAERFQKLYKTTPSAPFLWQAPNSHATLYFGDKWAELHSFLSNRVVKHQESTKSVSRAKLVSATMPAWTEYMLEFMRARGYALLYPGRMSEALVMVHNELYHVPEEFSPRPKELTSVATPLDEDGPFLRGDVAPSRPPNHAELPIIPSSKALHLALPFDGDLPEIPHLPHLLYNGTIIQPVEVERTSQEYADTFRKEIGGCTIPKGKHRKVVKGEARDLFCWGDEEEGEWVDDVKEAENLAVDGGATKTASVEATAKPTIIEADED